MSTASTPRKVGVQLLCDETCLNTKVSPSLIEKVGIASRNLRVCARRDCADDRRIQDRFHGQISPKTWWPAAEKLPRVRSIRPALGRVGEPQTVGSVSCQFCGAHRLLPHL